MSACFPPLNWHGLAWVALVPWLYVLPRLSPAHTWLLGTLLGLVFYRLGLAWLFALHGPIAGIILTIFAIWMGFGFRVVRLMMMRFSARAMLWAMPLAFIGQEVLRCEALPRLRLPFLALGYSQAPSQWLAQIASIGGVYFLSGLIVAVNAAIAHGLLNRGRRAWLPAPAAAGAVLLLALAGQPRSFDDRMRVAAACVQAETPRTSVYSDLAAQALQATPAPALVVLPEHALVDYPDESHRIIQDLTRLAQQHGSCICVGAHTPAERGAECPYENVGLVIGPDGRIVARQAKCVPLPFFQDGNPARQSDPIETPLGRLGVLVCYDGLFTDHPRRLVDKGADILLVPVMDPADWPAQENQQHAAMAPFRSIELRRCAVRAASSGVSQIIDATGKVIARRTREQGAGTVAGDIYLNQERTVFVRGGYLITPITAGAFLAAVAALTIDGWLTGARRLLSRYRHTARDPQGIP